MYVNVNPNDQSAKNLRIARRRNLISTQDLLLIHIIWSSSFFFLFVCPSFETSRSMSDLLKCVFFLPCLGFIHEIGFWWQNQRPSQRNCITHFHCDGRCERNETKTAGKQTKTKKQATTNQSHCRRMNVVYVKYIYMCVTLRWTMVKNWFSFISDNLIIFPQNLNKEAGSL